MFKSSSDWTPFDDALDRAIRDLNHHDVGSPEYTKTLNVVSQLSEMRLKQKPSPVSRDTLVIAGTNLLGIILIIKHEYLNVITSRAMSLVIKPRVLP